jgi:hypothetical protein
MKAILLIMVLIFSACSIDPNNKEYKNHKKQEREKGLKKTKTEVLDNTYIIELYECEYIVYSPMNCGECSREYIKITHKGNCKYCEERKINTNTH